MCRKYLKLDVNPSLTRRGLHKMLSHFKPAVLKLESDSLSSNNKTIRYALELKKRGFSIREVRLLTRYKRSHSKSREHHLIAVTLTNDAKRGGLKGSEPGGDEAELRR